MASAPGRDMAGKLSILRQERRFTSRLTVRDLVRFGRYPHSRGRLTAEGIRAWLDGAGFIPHGW